MFEFPANLEYIAWNLNNCLYLFIAAVNVKADIIAYLCKIDSYEAQKMAKAHHFKFLRGDEKKKFISNIMNKNKRMNMERLHKKSGQKPKTK